MRADPRVRRGSRRGSRDQLEIPSSLLNRAFTPSSKGSKGSKGFKEGVTYKAPHAHIGAEQPAGSPSKASNPYEPQVTGPKGSPSKPSEAPHPFAGLARVEITRGAARVRAPMWAKVILDEVPGAYWSPDHRCWILRADRVYGLVDQLGQAGYIVRVIDHRTGRRDPLRLRWLP